MKGWTTVARSAGPRGRVVALAWLTAGLVWFTWPIWSSTTVASRAQVTSEAPWVLAAQTAGLVLLAAALWRDAGRRPEPLAAVAGLVLADCFLRAVLSPGTGGIEVVHALPFLAGAGLGLGAGVLTGAGAALLSTLLVATPAETLPAQCLVWALVGASGALLRGLPTVVAWLAGIPLAVLVGWASGVLLNLIGWAQDPGTSELHFVAGLPPAEVAGRLWAYTLETSWGLDLVRGLTSALLVLTLGLPVLRALRGPSHPGAAAPEHLDLALADAVRRRETSPPIARIWAVAPAEQEKTCSS